MLASLLHQNLAALLFNVLLHLVGDGADSLSHFSERLLFVVVVSDLIVLGKHHLGGSEVFLTAVLFGVQI